MQHSGSCGSLRRWYRPPSTPAANRSVPPSKSQMFSARAGKQGGRPIVPSISLKAVLASCNVLLTRRRLYHGTPSWWYTRAPAFFFSRPRRRQRAPPPASSAEPSSASQDATRPLRCMGGSPVRPGPAQRNSQSDKTDFHTSDAAVQARLPAHCKLVIKPHCHGREPTLQRKRRNPALAPLPVAMVEDACPPAAPINQTCSHINGDVAHRTHGLADSGRGDVSHVAAPFPDELVSRSNDEAAMDAAGGGFACRF